MTREDEIMAELIAIRRRSGLTQSQVAKQLGVCASAVSNFEARRNRRSTSLGSILRYAEVIGVDLRVVGG